MLPATKLLEAEYVKGTDIPEAPVQKGEPEIELVEGILFSYEYYVSKDPAGERFVIPIPSIDTSTIRMQIRKSVADASYEVWNDTNTILNINENSKVFFIQEKQDGYYEFYFGNDRVGKKPEVGNLITVQYVKSSGSIGNNASTFVPLGKLSYRGFANVAAVTYNIRTINEAIGGADPETNEEIKFNASNKFIVQDRAVTINDYKSIIQDSFNNIKTLKVWGGEDNNPIKYGKVIVCVQPQYGDTLTQSEKDYISNILKSKSVVTVGTEFVDPEYINMIVGIDVKYDPIKLPASVSLDVAVKSSVQYYSTMYLENFNSNFRDSKFSSDIDSSHDSILSNQSSKLIYKSLIPRLGFSQSYTIQFENKILKNNNSVTSSQFKILEDTVNWLNLSNNGNKVYASYTNNISKRVLVKEVGTVNFNTGIVYINNINIIAVNGEQLKIIVNPLDRDIRSGLNNILRIKQEDVSVKLISEVI
jgi:hypothetical protein